MRAKRATSHPCRSKRSTFSKKSRRNCGFPSRSWGGRGDSHAASKRRVILEQSMELPNREVRHGLVATYAEVVGSLALLSTERALVLPNGEFFPDRFTADEASV